jgi:Protein of unknown function (DUF2628)
MIALLLRARDAKHVAVYTIHEPGHRPARAPTDRIARAETLEFVADGFSWSTALFPPLYFVNRHMWTETLLYGVGLVVGVVALSALGLSPALMGVLIIATHLWLAFEAVELRRNALERGGWTMLGSVSGRNLAECERRFFDSWLSGSGEAPSESGTSSSTNGSSAMGDLENRLASVFGRFSRPSKS